MPKNRNLTMTSKEVIETLTKLNLTVAFLMDKLNVTPQEFQLYINTKLAEFNKAPNE